VPRPLRYAGACALAAFVWTIVVMPPVQPFDTYYVWHAARLWPDLTYSFPVLHHAMRLGTVIPVMVVQDFVGLNQISVVVASALMLALFTVGVYLVGRMLFSDAIGLAAVAIFLIHPFFTKEDGYLGWGAGTTGTLYPDHPAAGWYLVGVAALIAGSRRAGRAQTRVLVLAGVCFGMSYLTREFLAFMFAGIPVFFLLLRMPLRRLVAPAIPMLAILGIELVHNTMVWGDALARFRVASEHGALREEPLSRWFALGGFFNAMASHPLGWLFVGALVLTVTGAIVYRDRRLYLVLAMFATLWLPLTLWGGLIDPYQAALRVQLPRYWFAVLPGILIGALGTIALALRRLRSSTTRRVAVAALALIGLAYVVPAGVVLAGVKRDEDWRALRVWFAEHPEVTDVYIDGRSRQTLLFYQNSATGKKIFKGEVHTFERGADELPEQEIGHIPYLETVLGALEHPDPADGWRVIWRSPNGAITIWQR
jgi:hypothetical protein